MKKEIKDTFALHIKRYCKENGITTTMLRDTNRHENPLPICYQFISAIIHEKKKPKYPSIALQEKLATFLGIEDLFIFPEKELKLKDADN